MSRRNVLKAGAVTAVGVGLFSGTAAATNANQINFCGCSQICVEREDEDNGLFYAVTAEEDGDEWDFGVIRFGSNTDAPTSRCADVEGTDMKIIALMPQVNPDGEIYCNPHQCAQKPLAELLDLGDNAFEDVDLPSDNDSYTCKNEGDEGPIFGSGFDDIDTSDEQDGTVDIVQGRCGKPGRTPPGRN